MSQKGHALLIVLLIAVAIGGYLVYFGKISLPQKQIACTQDAKICPDGTAVGRSDPKCEFASCPSPKTDETANWKTYTDQNYGFTIQYPDKYKQSVQNYPNTYKANSVDISPIREIWLSSVPTNSLEASESILMRLFKSNVSVDNLKSGKIIPYRFKNNNWQDIKIGFYQGICAESIGDIFQKTDPLVIVQLPKIVIVITHTSMEDKSCTNDKELNQILSLFKLTQ